MVFETITCILMENINMHVFETIASLIVSPFFINAVIQCKMIDCQVLWTSKLFFLNIISPQPETPLN